MSTTDTLYLNKSQMFEQIRSGLTSGPAKTQNLLECKDDLLFAWDAAQSCLLVINWRAAKLKGLNVIKHQMLIPSTPQNFSVERVLSSTEGSLIALAGPRGLAVLELPPRWGPNGQFMEGKDTITCRTNNIDGLFFNNNPQIEIRQVRFHPASPTDSHILVLFSDNTIRVYDNCILRHVWQIGPTCTTVNNIKGLSTLPNPFALGESAVDFDIGPPITSNDLTHFNIDTLQDISNKLPSNNDVNRMESNGKVMWPIIILRENGNIYVLSAGIDTEKPRLEGPLTIRPQTDNNYGLDSCAILVIPSLPPTVIIAESTGKLHHGLLLEADVLEKSFNEVDSSIDIYPSEWTIEVLETVELELGIPIARNISTSYSCPIHLKKDPVNEIRYFAYHNTGLHSVTLNFIKEIDRYLNSNDLSTLSNKSQAEYLVCTKINEANMVNSVCGFAFMLMPSTIVLLLSSGQVVSLDLMLDIKLINSSLVSADWNNKSKQSYISNKKSTGLSFSELIQSILKRSVNQPIIMLNKSMQPTSQESYEVLMQSIEVFRTHYMKKHEQVRGEFLQKLNIIKLRKQQQKKDIEYLEKERDLIRENAHQLAERFEEISENQELLLKKCQDLVRQTNSCLPYNSQAEKEFALQVHKINNVVKSLASAPQRAKENISKQCYHIHKYVDENPNKLVNLPEKQENTIKEILMQMMDEIDGQIKEVKRINNILKL